LSAPPGKLKPLILKIDVGVNQVDELDVGVNQVDELIEAPGAAS
jgi:hypothetical protein